MLLSADVYLELYYISLQRRTGPSQSLFFARNVVLTGLKVQEENTDGIQPKITLLDFKECNLTTTVTPGIQQTTTIKYKMII